MATLNLGRIKPVFRGAYAGGTSYVIDDIVVSGNETFICILASTGNATSNATYWTKLAAKGTDGTDVGATITTQGDVLYRDGSGLARLAAGTSGQVLQTGGSGANPSWGTVSSDFVKIASGDIPDDASHFTLDNIFTSNDGYYIYKVFLTHQDFAAGNGPIALRFVKNSDGGQYTTSKYCYVQNQNYRSSSSVTTSVNGEWNQDRFKFGGWDSTDNDNAYQKNSWEFTFFDPITNYGQNVHYHACFWEAAGNYFLEFTGVGTMTHNTVPMRGLRFYSPASKNFASGGYYCVYGLKH